LERSAKDRDSRVSENQTSPKGIPSSVILLGTIVDGVPPGNNEDEWVNALLGISGVTGGTVNAPTQPPNQGPELVTRFAGTVIPISSVSSTPTKIDPAGPIPGTFTGIALGKYGAPQGSDQGSAVFYIVDELNFSLPSTWGGIDGAGPITGQQGISHTTYWPGTPRVPDGGATVLLLGAGLAGLGLMRRRT
jgi:hypothetical protein